MAGVRSAGPGPALSLMETETLIAWLEAEDFRIARHGRPLSKKEQAIADKLGIDEPVNILAEKRITLPKPIKDLCASFGLSEAAGFTFDHGIIVTRPGLDLVAHELTHVRQRENYDHLSDFVSEYLRQCKAHGYEDAPFEVEARKIQHEYK